MNSKLWSDGFEEHTSTKKARAGGDAAGRGKENKKKHKIWEKKDLILRRGLVNINVQNNS